MSFHMSLFHLRSMKLKTKKLMVVPFLQDLAKFDLYLHSFRYSNSPYVTCLRLDFRGGWTLDLEESYLLNYSEYHTQGT